MVRDIFRILTSAEKRTFIRLIILDIVVSILDIAFLVILLAVINFYTRPGTNNSILSFTTPVLKQYPLLLIVGYFIFFIIKNAFAFSVTSLQYSLVYRVASRCSKEKLSAWLNGNFPDFVKIDSSVMIRSINQQPVEFGHYVLRGMQMVIGQSILIAFIVTAILIYNAFLFAVLLLILLPPVILIAWVIKKRLASSRKAGKHTSERALQHLHEALAGYIESNIYNKEDFFVSRYYRKQSALNGFLADQQVIQNLPSRFMEVFAMLGLVLLICIHYYSTSAGSIDVIIIGAFIAAAYKIIPGVVKVLNGIGQMRTYEYTVRDLLKLNKEALLPGRAEASSAPTIKLNSLTFSYGETPILKNFSAEFNSGDFVVISGKSGSGKTTLINILLGLLQPQNGTITVNKQTHHDGLRSLWNGISYCKQQPFFIYDTIARNITFDETYIDHKKLAEVLFVTHAADFEEKENYMITEDGKNLSGGQRQRVLFARALYKPHDLLIMDEPFNELDEAAESGFLEFLKIHAASGKIVLLITHNSNALNYCNKKIQLDV